MDWAQNTAGPESSRADTRLGMVWYGMPSTGMRVVDRDAVMRRENDDRSKKFRNYEAMKLVGLTGGICCGKSTVVAILRSLEAPNDSKPPPNPRNPGLGIINGRLGIVDCDRIGGYELRGCSALFALRSSLFALRSSFFVLRSSLFALRSSLFKL